MTKPVVSAQDAAALIADGATVGIGGSGAGHAIPDKMLEAIGERKRYATFRDGWTGLTLSKDGLIVETMRN